MTMSDLACWSVKRIREAIVSGECSAQEVAQAFLDNTSAREPELQAFLWLEAGAILSQAREIDRRVKSGELREGRLVGVPVAIKDTIVTLDSPTTCGSRILENYHPPYDATVVRRLREEGAILFGKTNCDEFAMGSSTENSSFQVTTNPFDKTRVPGGSSGGSAAAVAAGCVPLALGTDTGGSVRQPAAFCGVVGLKPTYGRVSRYGLVAFASSLDQIGPLARSVEDLALLLESIAGVDPRDSTASSRPVEPYSQITANPPGNLKLGLPRQWLDEGLDGQVRLALNQAVATLRQLGHQVVPVDLPHSRLAIAAYYIIATAEASSNLARYDGVRYGYRAANPDDLQSLYLHTRSQGFGEEVKRRIMLGTYVLSSGYYDAFFLKAARIRRLILDDYRKAFQEVDLLLGPTAPTLPFRLGEKIADPLQMYLSDVYTVTGNLAGIPALSLCGGFSHEGLPIGLQLSAWQFDESRLLAVAHQLEKALKLPPRRTGHNQRKGSH